MTAAAASGSRLDALRDELQPVRLALLDEARGRANQIVAEGEREAKAIVGEATTAAESEIHRARRRATRAAQARARQALDQVRADCHEQVLDARAAIRDRVVDTARRAVLDLRDDARYPDLLDQLESQARHQLGPDAVIDRDPEGLGGVIARYRDQRVDYTLVTLADRALAVLGDEVEQLWM